MVVACAFGSLLLGVQSVRRSVVDYFCVTGASMQPTLLAGDCILVRKGRFTGARVAPPRGTVVVLHLGGGGYVVKRLLAGPGDTVSVRAGGLLVNGTALHEPYVPSASGRGVEPPGDWHYAFLLPEHRTAAYAPTAQGWGPLVVPDGAFFVLGDNRGHSGDSRFFGFVKPEEIVGLPRRVVWSSAPRGPHLGRVRVGRIGARL
ncbi:MAG: signal peptidase I [Gemmatimonadetes bacterium]|nr:signal peptidase I [Gemmatimonadota bacterium]